MQPTAIALVFVATAFIGTADLFGGVASRRSKPLAVTAWSQAVGVPFIVVIAAVVGGDLIAVDLALGVCAGLGSAIGVTALYRGFARSDVGIVAPTAATTAAVVPIGVGLVAGERPSTVVALGVGLAVVSILLVGYAKGGYTAGARGLAHGLVSGVGFGAMVLAYAATSVDSGLWSAAVGRIAAAVIAGVLVALTGTAWRIAVDARRATFLAGALAGLGMGAFVAASQRTELVILGVALAMFPTVTVVLAAIFLRERLSRFQWMGVALAGGAVALVSIG